MNKKEGIGVLSGVIIMLIPFLSFLYVLSYSDVYSYFNAVISDYSAFLWMIGGFVAAFLAGKNIKDGIWTGFLAVLISNILFFSLGSPILDGFNPFIIFFIIVAGIFGILGGVMGGLVNRWRSKTITKENFILKFILASSLFISSFLFIVPSPANDLYGYSLEVILFLGAFLPSMILITLYGDLLTPFGYYKKD
jgi:hypothetical protein